MSLVVCNPLTRLLNAPSGSARSWHGSVLCGLGDTFLLAEHASLYYSETKIWGCELMLSPTDPAPGEAGRPPAGILFPLYFVSKFIHPFVS